jgi:ribosome biogenesis protein BRX1
VFENSEFISPASVRAGVKRAAGEKYRVRKEGDKDRDDRRKRVKGDLPEDLLSRDRVFA